MNNFKPCESARVRLFLHSSCHLSNSADSFLSTTGECFITSPMSVGPAIGLSTAGLFYLKISENKRRNISFFIEQLEYIK